MIGRLLGGDSAAPLSSLVITALGGLVAGSLVLPTIMFLLEGRAKGRRRPVLWGLLELILLTDAASLFF